MRVLSGRVKACQISLIYILSSRWSSGSLCNVSGEDLGKMWPAVKKWKNAGI